MAGCNVNAAAINDSRRPIMNAIVSGHASCVAALCEASSLNLMAVDQEGRNAFSFTSQNEEVNRLLQSFSDSLVIS